MVLAAGGVISLTCSGDYIGLEASNVPRGPVEASQSRDVGKWPRERNLSVGERKSDPKFPRLSSRGLDRPNAPIGPGPVIPSKTQDGDLYLRLLGNVDHLVIHCRAH